MLTHATRSVDRIMLAAGSILLAGAIGYGWMYSSGPIPAAVGGGLLVALWAALRLPHEAVRSWIVPVLGMALVANLIHAAHGRLETHFAVFAFLAMLLGYRDWRAIVAGAAAIAVHHLSFNYFQQWGWGAFCFAQPSLAKVLEHAVYVVVEAGCLVHLAVRSRADFAAGSEVSEIARELAGNGTVNLALRPTPAVSTAGRSLRGALDSLAGTVGAIRAASHQVAVAADQIASGNRDLAGRTEQAGARLQDTAASAEQLTATVQGNATAAGDAEALARQARELAERSNGFTQSAIASMARIRDSATRIEGIVGAIDSIAFQTNILALNAAVEAARAGEAGRGFAVVASEVRSLSQKSAEAAREIKSLVAESTSHAASGAQEIGQVGTSMQSLLTVAGEVSAVLARIAQASGEQTGAVRAISDALVELDAMTQQNAALVEQVSAASDNLQAQGQTLAQSVQGIRC